MNSECRELEVLRSAGAAGALEGDEAARLAAHLDLCPACRAAAEAERQLVDLARLPPPGLAEARVTADLPARTLAELRGRGLRRRAVLRFGTAAGVAVAAAAAALLLLGPVLFRSDPPPTVADAAWQVPDMDALWSASAVLEVDSYASDGDTWGDDALAAYDAWAGD